MDAPNKPVMLITFLNRPDYVYLMRGSSTALWHPWRARLMTGEWSGSLAIFIESAALHCAWARPTSGAAQ